MMTKGKVTKGKVTMGKVKMGNSEVTQVKLMMGVNVEVQLERNVYSNVRYINVRKE
jgi:hypothetical protein